MNKLLRQFLSGGSLAALQLCALGGGIARAAGTTISNNRTNVVINTNKDFILVSPTGHLTGSLTNNATVGVNSFGIEVQSGAGIAGQVINNTNGIINASRTGIAIQSGADLVGGIKNLGKIQVLATNTSGMARGIDYRQTGSQTMNLTNSGTVLVSATGTHVSSSIANHARGLVEINTNAHNSAPTLNLTNSGAVTLKAGATVSASDGTTRAEADARFALSQAAFGTRSATLALTNSAALHLQATAKAANSSDRAYAIASAKQAIVQSQRASALVAGTVVTETITNSGGLSLAAIAKGTGNASTGYAAANAGLAIEQFAERAADVEQSLTNSGQISIVAAGTAKAASSSASANADVRDVLIQEAQNSSASASLARKANLTISNSGAMSLYALAKGTGTQASEQATISAVEAQFAYREGVVNEKITNTNTGILSLVAHATALATAASASAKGLIGDVFRQYASDASVLAADSSITQTISNSASLSLTATGKATADVLHDSSAQATGLIENVFAQTARDVITTAQTITNSGALSLTAKGTALASNLNATGTRYQALGQAFISSVFRQSAIGTHVTSNKANSKITQSISNSGALTLVAVANAQDKGLTAYGFASSQSASARARISSVFYQEADNATVITQSLTNSATLKLNATALAKFTGTRTEKAFANASVRNVFEQSASGNYFPGASIAQAISNTGSLTIGAQATALDTPGSRADITARAEVHDVFYQSGQNAQTIAQTVTNSGALTIAVAAKATDLARDRYGSKEEARATIGNVFEQSAESATGGAHSSITQSITNSGALTLTASAAVKRGVATQTGTGSGTAHAGVHNVFSQAAYDALATAQTISNTGAIVLNAKATGTAVGSAHKAYVLATGEHLFSQYASGDDLTNSAATQTISNTASIGLTLSAKAKAQNAFTNISAAFASAKAARLFDQQVRNTLNGIQAITNSGAITVNAKATATGVGQTAFVGAKADVTQIFRQRFTADSGAVEGGTVSQVITNSGNISLTLAASANGQINRTSEIGASARASASHLFSQEANLTDSSSGTLNQTINNTGSITLSETTNATSSGDRDYAESDSFELFEQSARDSGNVTQSITSGGAITATLAATAKNAVSSAEASAYMGSIIDQYVSDSSKVTQTATISNTGTITITETATAVAPTAGHSAFAEVGNDDNFVYQEAISNSGAVSQTFTNNAAIKLTWAAIATGVTRATALGEMSNTGFEQRSYGGSSLSQTLTNNGAITISISGKAKGKNYASARATLGSKLWQQSGADTGKPASQTLTNTGNLSVALLAQATATKNAIAEAGLHSGLAHQSATAGNLGVLTQSITNSGAIGVVATALANGKTHASAKVDGNTMFHQEAGDYTDFTQTVTNSGAISLTGTAKALAANAVVENTAGAFAGRIVYQSERSALITSAAGIFDNQTITNSGAISIKNAATATGAGQITASAEDAGIFDQVERRGSAVTQKISNSGSVTISLTAKGKTSGNGTDNAVAGGNRLFSQFVNQSNDPGQAANLTITNNGAFSLAAAATATGVNRAHADAFLGDVFSQSADGSNSANLAITNSATIAVNNVAKANAKGQAAATGRANFASQSVSADTSANFTNAVLSLTNSGKVTLAGAGTAIATNSAKANAKLFGVGQYLELENNGTAAPTGSLSINNSGTLGLTATAKATAGNRVRAKASATGAVMVFRQSGGSAGTSNLSGTISFANSGTVSVAANATVLSATPHVALVGTTPSVAFADAIGLEVFSEGRNLTAHFTSSNRVEHRTVTPTLALSNSGTMSVAAVAVGAGVDHAKATATAAGFLVQATSEVAQKSIQTHPVGGGTVATSSHQYGGSPVKGTISNSGTMTVSATATGGKATAGGIAVEGSVEAASITNAINGSLSVSAGGATALAGGINLTNYLNSGKSVYHTNTGVYTSRRASTSKSLLVPATDVTGAITNSGTMTVSATGTVSEEADGILVNAAKVSNTILNTGVMNITASGPAAVANGFHLVQSNYGTTGASFFNNPVVGANSSGNATHHVRTRIGFVTFAGVLNNTGTITVTANASTGNGSANGIDVEGGSLQGGSVLNSGTINAIATGPTAIANGVLLSGGGAVGVSNRSGTINATATSSSGAATANGLFLSDGTLTGTILTGGNGTVTANGANGATANGWLIIGAGKLVMVGSGGVLNVNATATKGTAAANGINVQGGALTGSTITNSDTINTHATGATGTTPVANSILVAGTGAVTVANAGGTLSSLVTLGGATSYGNVINVTGASAAAITLSGGTIAGNIVEASGGNAITVSGGNTLFNGAINPSKALLGSLTIASTGTLTLGINGGLGAGNVWTGSFVQQGTLALNATTDTSVEGTIHAATATLSGPAVLNINLAGAAIPLSSTYKVVFTTGALTGTWSSVTAPDPTFLTAAGVYTANEADITLTRASFGAISGLTPNEQAVGNALETIYEAGGATGPLGSLTSALFALTPTQYADALQQLSGETVGDLVATDAADLQNMVDTVISHLDEDSGTGAVAGTALNSLGLPGVHPAQDEDMGPVSLWGGFIASGSQVSSTISSPSYHTHMNGLMAGADFTVSPNALLGIAVGYNNGGLRTARDQGGFNVIEVSGYGRYADPNEPWYVVGDLSYGGFRNTLHRTIAIPGLATSTLTGKFDSSTLALYGEAGYHLDSTIKLTPYAAISYLNADADPFTETGSFVAPLSVAKASSNATISYLGAWFSQTWMSDNLAITPSIKAAWEHDFNTNFWTVNAGFAPVSTVSFGINGSAYSKDAAFIDAGVTLNGGDNVSFGLNYQGRLSSDRTQSAIVGRIVFKF